MKNMKTIIRLLGATSITTVAISTVVACDKPKTLQSDVDDIINTLQSGIQGKTLTNINTQKDAVELFQAAAVFTNKDASIILATPADEKKLLVKGDNTIKVIVKLKTITSKAFEANIIGIQ